MTIIIVILVIAVIALAWIAIYNGLVKARMQTQESWSQIDVQLKRRNDLIPNLVETVKGYAKHESETLTKVTQLRQDVAAATTPADKMAASNQLSGVLSGFFARAEAYPDLKANTNFNKLQEELTNTENKIAYSRQLFNATTANYNTKLQSFPTNIVAGVHHFQPSEFLQVPEAEKEVPTVKF
ncbi:LemA family protein [Leuconostoc falkenbergense]|jgi:LemA protein|uniref:LemA family protein n=1 Tax=Leuconostoc falkenbergense TaxID=2766470 RepID=A0A9X3E9A5_9LACO|nr:LemA family protein [Leuconostoc falkenbergense]RDG20199.1 LemA family protein [Leuconostoc pseudomesenteroides]MCT4389909.1 LemA family protein [Leuconostoc falkenbergense]MCT4411167.1 LemA family protein [Leuconostoc falkenbergense]MCX7578712.1 LemA family protein [Leuconostoc falkenbergense]MDM7645446.1 LemA family protein [Leuconostoc falkenbergense]